LATGESILLSVGHSWPTSATWTGKSGHPTCVETSVTTQSTSRSGRQAVSLPPTELRSRPLNRCRGGDASGASESLRIVCLGNGAFTSCLVGKQVGVFGTVPVWISAAGTPAHSGVKPKRLACCRPIIFAYLLKHPGSALMRVWIGSKSWLGKQER
jgi:hypothetical protein